MTSKGGCVVRAGGSRIPRTKGRGGYGTHCPSGGAREGVEEVGSWRDGACPTEAWHNGVGREPTSNAHRHALGTKPLPRETRLHNRLTAQPETRHTPGGPRPQRGKDRGGNAPHAPLRLAATNPARGWQARTPQRPTRDAHTQQPPPDAPPQPQPRSRPAPTRRDPRRVARLCRIAVGCCHDPARRLHAGSFRPTPRRPPRRKHGQHLVKPVRRATATRPTATNWRGA